VSGAQLREVVMKPIVSSIALPGLAGLRIRAECCAGGLELTTRPDGSAVGDDEWLLVATNDFVALGGDRILKAVLPAGGFLFTHDVGLARDAIAAALRSRGDGVREADLVDPASPRWSLPSARPVTYGV
jgi:hypothetical protein